MPKYKKYPNEAPEAARRRIAMNRAKDRQEGKETSFDKVKTKGDMMAENIMPSIKNMGYQGWGVSPTVPQRGLARGIGKGIGISIGKRVCQKIKKKAEDIEIDY